MTTAILNPSGLKAVGRAVLCRPYHPEFDKSIIAIPDHVMAMELMHEMRATVIQVGDGCWPDEPARAVPGDKVLVSKFTGAIVKGTLDGEIYRVVNDNDIFCQIEKGSLDDVMIRNPIVESKRIARGG